MSADENKVRMAIIAGAAKATQFINKKRNVTEAEVIKHISDNMDEILKNIDNPI